MQHARSNALDACAETGDLYDDDSASEISLEVGAEAGPEFETQVQERLQSASVAESGPTTELGVPTAIAPQHSALRRFSKDHAVSDDIQKRFMIAVENDEKAAKKRVQDWLVRVRQACHDMLSYDLPLRDDGSCCYF